VQPEKLGKTPELGYIRPDESGTAQNRIQAAAASNRPKGSNRMYFKVDDMKRPSRDNVHRNVLPN
jgi:hypothetical protein